MIRWICERIPGPLWDRMAQVPLLRWAQDHMCIVCGKPTRRPGSHWPCERSLL